MSVANFLSWVEVEGVLSVGGSLSTVEAGDCFLSRGELLEGDFYGGCKRKSGGEFSEGGVMRDDSCWW